LCVDDVPTLFSIQIKIDYYYSTLFQFDEKRNFESILRAKKKLLYHFVNFQILTGFFKKSPTVFQNQNRKFEIVHVK